MGGHGRRVSAIIVTGRFYQRARQNGESAITLPLPGAGSMSRNPRSAAAVGRELTVVPKEVGHVIR